MRDQVAITEFSKLWSALKSLGQGFQISVISQSVRDKALENLLISKGLITAQELEDAVRKEAQAMVEETEKAKTASTIVTPNSDSKIILPGSPELPPTL